jgi:hypothetical protein
MDPALRLQPGQRKLTPVQEAEARRFIEACIQRQLSTEPVDELQAEAFLRQAYVVAGLDPPQRIHWLDGPLQLVAVLVSSSLLAILRASVGDSMLDSVLASLRASVWGSVQASVGDSGWAGGWASLRNSMWDSVGASVLDSIRARVWASVGARVWNSVEGSGRPSVWASVGARVRASVEDSVWNSLLASRQASERDSVLLDVGDYVGGSVRTSVWSYDQASCLACSQFFDGYLAPNALQALAHFNALVSGYWLGQDTAVLVRRPALLARDSQGRLHSATGKCLEYPDGWGFYAWHGVRVPERVILAPERLSREDFLHAKNVEVRRVMQERMGEQFMEQVGGVVIDSGPRGTLYELALPNDRERVARYVQVQDASTDRSYFLRVPPTIQTAAEAVAWSFQLTIEEYHPGHET